MVYPWKLVLLVDIFENSHESCVMSYSLDSMYYYILPDFMWYPMLKHIHIRFELLTDIDIVERGIRGGFSQCSDRYVQANNKYMRSYDPTEPSLYLIYLMYYDVNNLYRWTICQSLPNFDRSKTLLGCEHDRSGFAHRLHSRSWSRIFATRSTHWSFCPTRDKPPDKRDDKLLETVW